MHRFLLPRLARFAHSLKLGGGSGAPGS